MLRDLHLNFLKEEINEVESGKAIKLINKSKFRSFEKINKVEKKLTKQRSLSLLRKRNKAHEHKIRNGTIVRAEKEDLLKTVIDYFPQFYENKCENFDEMYSSPRKYNLSKLIPARQV